MTEHFHSHITLPSSILNVINKETVQNLLFDAMVKTLKAEMAQSIEPITCYNGRTNMVEIEGHLYIDWS